MEYVGNSDRVVNVLDFGARGDRQTNCTEAFDKAVLKAAEVAVPVYVPPGRYLLDRLLLGADEQLGGTQTVIYGQGPEMSILEPTPEADPIFIRDRWNAAKIEIHNLGVFCEGHEGIQVIVSLGHNTHQWGTGGEARNLLIRDAPNATGFHCDMNIAEIKNCTIGGCAKGIVAKGAGLKLDHVQLTGMSDVSADIWGPCRVVDLEVEAPTAYPCVRFREQHVVLGLWLSLHSSATGPLIQCDVPLGVILGPDVSLNGHSAPVWLKQGELEIPTQRNVIWDLLHDLSVSRMGVNGVKSSYPLANAPGTSQGFYVSPDGLWFKVSDIGYVAGLENTNTPRGMGLRLKIASSHPSDWGFGVSTGAGDCLIARGDTTIELNPKAQVSKDGGLGLFDETPMASQASKIADPTDLPEALAAIAKLIDVVEGLGAAAKQ